MDLYLSNCLKAAEAAASKAASDSLKSDKETCRTVSAGPSIQCIYLFIAFLPWSGQVSGQQVESWERVWAVGRGQDRMWRDREGNGCLKMPLTYSSLGKAPEVG